MLSFDVLTSQRNIGAIKSVPDTVGDANDFGPRTIQFRLHVSDDWGNSSSFEEALEHGSEFCASKYGGDVHSEQPNDTSSPRWSSTFLAGSAAVLLSGATMLKHIMRMKGLENPDPKDVDTAFKKVEPVAMTGRRGQEPPMDRSLLQVG